MQINHTLLDLYRKGDRIGAIFEGQTPNGTVDEAKLAMAMRNGQGTDESDQVDLFLQFVERKAGRYHFPEIYGEWAKFHGEHHGMGYGRTHRDYLASIKGMRGKEPWYLAQNLVNISREVNSFGNGALALVYPVYCWARSHEGLHAAREVSRFTSLSHNHEDAIWAARTLSLWLSRGEVDDVWGMFAPANELSAYGTLLMAAEWSKLPTMDEVIRGVLSSCVDTDSVLSMALMLWGIRNGEKP